MAVLSKDQLKTNIQSELADNNAGSISAYDVRHNMEDIVDSVNQMVASGNFDSTTPFTGSNVRAKIRSGQYGAFVAESGVIFPYADGGGSTRQLVAYNGPGSIDHNNLSNLTTGDVHTQYLNINGQRTMTGNLGLNTNWINSSGDSQISSSDNRGLKFEYTGNGVEKIHVGSGTSTGNGTQFVFDADNSTFRSAKGVAKAWLNFDATPATPVINNYFNINSLEKLDTGKFKIVFTSGTFGDNYYIALGSSNARSTAASEEDFTMNTVGTTLRAGNDASALRSVTFSVLDEGGQFVDAKINELVVYGRGPSEGSGIHPTVVVS
jgi:hypothetical protein